MDQASLALAQWTADKDFLEHCNAQDGSTPTKECLKRQKLGLAAPPGLVLNASPKDEAIAIDEGFSSGGSLSQIPSTAIEATFAVQATSSVDLSHYLITFPPTTGLLDNAHFPTTTDSMLVGPRSEQTEYCTKPWYNAPGSTWTTKGTYAKCVGSCYHTNCLTGVVFTDPPRAKSAVTNFDCWPMWTEKEGHWQATRTTIDAFQETCLDVAGCRNNCATIFSCCKQQTSAPLSLNDHILSVSSWGLLSYSEPEKPTWDYIDMLLGVFMLLNIWLLYRRATVGRNLSPVNRETRVEKRDWVSVAA
jgi:hypothetical protein